MKQTILIALTVIAQFASANTKQCQFPYDLAENKGVQVVRNFAVNDISTLTNLQKVQLQIVTERLGVQSDDFTKSAGEIKEMSDGQTLQYIIFRFADEIYTRILLYPGDISYSVIFKGSLPIAQEQDGDVQCE